MVQTVHSDNSGFTLIELLAAMVIMLVGLLGLLQTVNVALLHNMSNQLRNDAILVADEHMSLEMTKPFDLISTVPPNPGPYVKNVVRKIYNADKSYTVTRSGASVTSNTKSVSIVVSWTYKGQSYTQNISSLISKFSK